MAAEFDLLLRGGLVVDGTGAEPFPGDLAVAGGRIAAVGTIEAPEGIPVLDVSGLAVSPGFIDIHSHSELLCLAAPGAESKVASGVTTEFSGNCGSSPFPATGRAAEDLRRTAATLEIEPGWSDVGGFFEELKAAGSAVNRAFFVGHGSVRSSTMGHDNRAPNADDLEQMKREVASAMEAGCWGLSSGLIYPPGLFAETAELIELAREAARFGGIYTSHIRGEGATVIDAGTEAIEIGRAAGIGVQISHIKVAGMRNWRLHEPYREMLLEAHRSGADFMADRYPYIASSTWLASVLPAWTYEGGRESLLDRLNSAATRKKIAQEVIGSHEPDYWQRVRIAWAQSDDLKCCEGKSVAEVAAERGAGPIETAFEILIEDGAQTSAVFFSMSEDHLVDTLQWPFVMVASDAGARGLSGPSAEGKPHPRAYGTPTRVLGKYVRDGAVLSLAEGVRKMTSMPAQRAGLKSRGTLAAGMAADITVFDPATVTDRATFDEPKRLSAGMKHVLVSGTFVLRDGEFTGERPGRLLVRGED